MKKARIHRRRQLRWAGQARSAHGLCHNKKEKLKVSVQLLSFSSPKGTVFSLIRSWEILAVSPKANQTFSLPKFKIMVLITLFFFS